MNWLTLHTNNNDNANDSHSFREYIKISHIYTNGNLSFLVVLYKYIYGSHKIQKSFQSSTVY